MTSILPLSLSEVVVKRRGQVLLGPLDLSLGAEGITIIMGPNGAGKTKLLRAVHGVERIAAGVIQWQVPTDQAQVQQAFVFQAPIMLRRTVAENLIYPLRLAGVARKGALARAQDWADKVGLGDAMRRSAPNLSGGEKQKLALARALISGPQVLFLDEPCANLDGRATREIEAILQDAKAGGTRIIMATHDIGQARRLADDVVFLMHGKVIEQGAAEPFFDAPQTPQARALLKGEIVE
ncbi:MAG: ATP-binding cassette domain-containing protein [Pseudomonadota bacterium]